MNNDPNSSQKLEQWLSGSSKTWRWNGGHTGGYRGVEVANSTLVFFEWTHDHGVDEGKRELGRQKVSDFVDSGPVVEIPQAIERAIHAWLKDKS